MVWSVLVWSHCYHILTVVPWWCGVVTVTVVSVTPYGPHYSTVDLQLVSWSWSGPGGDSHGATVAGAVVTELVVVAGRSPPLSSPLDRGRGLGWAPVPRGPSVTSTVPVSLTALPGWPDQGRHAKVRP